MDLRVKWTDPDMNVVGFDAGGGEIYHYKDIPFTGILEADFYPNGNVQTEIQCVDGYKQGFSRTYYENGQMSEESFMKRNLLYGVLRQWDENGNLTYQSGDTPEPMLALAVDVHYRGNIAKVASVLFEPKAAVPQFADIIKIEYPTTIDEYIPGEFYKRELPCILKLFEKINLTVVDLILVDGYVYIDNNKQFGLGGRLWEALKESKPIIGVAKNSFKGNKNNVKELKRGESHKPLYISSIGVDLNYATELIKDMKGNFRIPDVLKTLDKITEEP